MKPIKAVIFVAPLLLVTLGQPRAQTSQFEVLHEVLRHFEVAFIDHANLVALLFGGVEGLKRAAPECRVELGSDPHLYVIHVQKDTAYITRLALKDIKQLEKQLVQAAALVMKHNLAKSQQDLEHALVRSIVARCGDPWSVFLEEDFYQRLLDDGTTQIGSTGMLLEAWGGGLRVLDVFGWSPADKAGIRRGQIVNQIAGRNARDLNELEALALMRGKVGSTVEVVVDKKPHQLKLVLEPKRNLEVNPLSLGIAHVHLLNFQANTGRRLAAVMRKLKKYYKGNLRGLILDLRGNPGGLVTEGTQVMGLFMKPGTVVRIVSKKHMKEEALDVNKMGEYRKLPMVLMVDHRTASVSEIVAMAVRDYQRAQLVGEKTLGKGTVQVIMELMDGSALKLSIGRYYSPKGTPIYEGIEPDITVRWDGQGEDPQLAKAISLLSK